ncbi:ribonuclease [Bacillus clarus]
MDVKHKKLVINDNETVTQADYEVAIEIEKKLEGQRQEQKPKEEKKQPEETQKSEQSKVTVNTDKSIYENEIKPKIDAMIKEYDDIWNQEWRPIWGEASKGPESVEPNAIKEKMEKVSNRYDDLSTKNTEFKGAEKLSNPELKEKMDTFRVEFGLATNYRSNAGKAVTQGLKGIAPMKERMEEARKSIKLSDEKLINAVASLTEIESKLGVKRN